MASILSNSMYPQQPQQQFNPFPAPQIPMQSQPNQDPMATVNALINQILGSNDPTGAFNQLIASIPAAQQAMGQINQLGNGDPKTAFMNLAASQGKQALAQQIMQRMGLA